MRTKIVITGGAGFIGSNLVSYINNLRQDYEIIIIDNYSTGNKKNHIKAKKNHKIRYIKGNTKNIKNILKNEKNINTIFHFAEFSRIVQSFKNYQTCLETNMVATLEVIKFCSMPPNGTNQGWEVFILSNSVNVDFTLTVDFIYTISKTNKIFKLYISLLALHSNSIR